MGWLKENINRGFDHLINRRLADDLRKRSQLGIVFLVLIALSVFFSYDFANRHPELLNSFIIPLVTVGMFRGAHLFSLALFMIEILYATVLFL